MWYSNPSPDCVPPQFMKKPLPTCTVVTAPNMTAAMPAAASLPRKPVTSATDASDSIANQPSSLGAVGEHHNAQHDPGCGRAPVGARPDQSIADPNSRRDEMLRARTCGEQQGSSNDKAPADSRPPVHFVPFDSFFASAIAARIPFVVLAPLTRVL